MDPEQLIYAKVTVDEGVSAENPLGIFTLDFEGHTASDGVPDPAVAFRGGCSRRNGTPQQGRSF